MTQVPVACEAVSFHFASPRGDGEGDRAVLFGWSVITGVVVAVDLFGSRTMSDAFRSLSRHPVGGPVLAATWIALTAHLFGLIPARRDPLQHLPRLGIRIR